MQKSSLQNKFKSNLEIFNALAGVWDIERKINNHLHNHLSGRVIGQASFKQKTPTELYYREEGIFITHTTNKIFQEYLYIFNALTQTIDKHLLSQGLLYSLEIDNLKSVSGKHSCSLDQYQAQYNFQNLFSQKMFMLEYQVHGPHKNYISQTLYRHI